MQLADVCNVFFCADQVGGILKSGLDNLLQFLERLFNGFSGFAENPE